MTDQFPVGLRVLVVDDDRTCLTILEKMLRNCSYNVTTCGTARGALAMLREKRQCYDLVISDVYMPDMDGFKLLELVGLEMDLPVIMMSADGETSVVMKGITHGACDYLIKPIRMKELRNIWQHVIRKRRNVIKDVDSSVLAEHERNKRRSEDADSYLPANTRKRTSSKEDEEEEFDTEDSTSLKKPRVVWSVELHQQFVTAVNQLGIDKAVPKRILELMHVQGLTRENVASHLQKYRLYLKRLSVAHHQNMNMGTPQSFEVLQSHPVISPGSSQTLAAIQSAYLARPNGINSTPSLEAPPVFVVRPRIPPPASNQRGLFPSVPDLDQLTKSQAPSLSVPSQDTRHHLLSAPSNGMGDGNIPPGMPTSLAEQLLQQQQQQVPHYVQKAAPDTFVDFPSARNALLDDIPKSLANAGLSRPPPVKCEQPDALNGGWNACPGFNRLGWQPNDSDIVQNSGVPYSANFDKQGDVLLHNQDYLLGPPRMTEQQMNNNNMKVKEEYHQATNGFTSEQIIDELSSVCYKPEHEGGFFYNELGLEGYIHGNLYVK